MIALRLLSSCVLASLFLLPQYGRAAVQIESQSSTTSLHFSSHASGVDLIDASQSTLLSTSVTKTHDATSFPGAGINDGHYLHSPTNANTFFSISANCFPATAIYNLNTTHSPDGYDITSIRSFCGWAAASTAQANQTYTVFVRHVGSSDYIELARVSHTPFPDMNGTAETMVTITSPDAALARGVDSIRFVFISPIGENGVPSGSGLHKGTVVREIDVFGTPTSGNHIAISSPNTRHIIQRSPENTADIPVSGIFSGDPERIEARALIMSGEENSGTTSGWQIIDPDPADGNFSGNLTGIAAGGWYELEVRGIYAGEPGVSAIRQMIGVGDIYITAGQSNSANHGAPAHTPASNRVVTRTHLTNSTWRAGYDPQPLASGSGGSPWSHLGDMLVASENIPIGFIAVGVGSTQVSQWSPASSHYTGKLKPVLQSLPSSGFKAILWHQGESDSIAKTSAETYATRLTAIIHQSRADVGWEIPWYISEASFHPNTRLGDEEPVAAGQRLTVFQNEQIYLGPDTDGFHLENANGGKLADTVHFNSTGLSAHAAQWHRILTDTEAPALRNGDFEENRTPSITGSTPLADGDFHIVPIADSSSPSVLGWRILSADGKTAADGENGFFNPSTGTYSQAEDSLNGGIFPGMSGRHVAMLSGGSAGNYFLQTTRFPGKPGHDRILTVALGVRDDASTFGSAKIELLSGSRILATKTWNKEALDALRGSDSSGTFTEVRLVHRQSEPSDGKNDPLAIRISKIGGSGTVLDFDNVRLIEIPTGYSLFQQEHWGNPPPAESAWHADPDGDGYINGIEYFLGLNPREPSSLVLPATIEKEGASWVRYRIPLNPEVTDHGLDLQYSLDLSVWHPAFSATHDAITVSRSVDEWVIDAKHEIHPRVFFRLELDGIFPHVP